MTKRYHADLPSWIFIGGISCLPCLLFAAQPHDDASAATLDINAKIFSRATANAILTLSPENKKKSHEPA